MPHNIQMSAAQGEGPIVRTDEDGDLVHWQYFKISFGPPETQTVVTATVGLPVTQVGTWDVGTVASVSAVGTVGTITNPVKALQEGVWNIATVGTVTSIQGPVTVTGTVGVEGPVTVSGEVGAVQVGTWDIATVGTLGAVLNPVTVEGTVGVTQAGPFSIGNVGLVATLTEITNPVAVFGLVGIDGTVTVTGTVGATQSGPWDIGTVTAVNEITNPVTVTGTVGVTQAGPWNVAAVTSITDPVTVTGTVTANGGTNLNTSALALEAGGNLAALVTAAAQELIALAPLVNWNEANRARVNPIAGQAGVAAGSGPVSALTQRVCLATDVPLPAGANVLGSVNLTGQPGAANLANGQVSVTTAAGGVQVVAARATRRAVTIVNLGTVDVYLGAGTVTTANGLLLVGLKGAALTLYTTAAVKAIVGAGTQTVAFVEEYE